MKPLRFLIAFALATVSLTAFAQSDAQKTFTQLKTLAGTWKATTTLDPPMPNMDMPIGEISMRVTSRGNALVHEMYQPGKENDPAHFDHPVTMFYLDTDKLVLTHYCDAGNRPRMSAKTSEDAKTIEFDFVDVTGNLKYGHMSHAVFTFIDANHHIEDWTFMMPGDKPMHAHVSLERK